MALLPTAHKMFRPTFQAIACIGLLALSACATPTTTALEPQNRPHDPRQARLYFFRPKILYAMALTAEVKLNGQTIGNVANGSYIFVDRPPGRYTVEVTTSIDPGRFEADLQVGAGTHYFELASKPAYAPTGGGGVVTLDPGYRGRLVPGRDGFLGTFRLSELAAAAGAAEIARLQGR